VDCVHKRAPVRDAVCASVWGGAGVDGGGAAERTDGGGGEWDDGGWWVEGCVVSAAGVMLFVGLGVDQYCTCTACVHG